MKRRKFEQALQAFVSKTEGKLSRDRTRILRPLMTYLVNASQSLLPRTFLTTDVYIQRQRSEQWYYDRMRDVLVPDLTGLVDLLRQPNVGTVENILIGASGRRRTRRPFPSTM